MKKLFSSIILVVLTFCVYSQTSEIPTPEFIDQPYFWLKESNELVKLSKENVETKTSVSMQVSYSFQGAKSPTEIHQTKNASFLITTKMPIALSSFSLFRLEVKKNKYRFVEIMAGGMGGMNMKDEQKITMEPKELGNDIYELVLSQPLTPGEYAITNGMNSFTFSVVE